MSVYIFKRRHNSNKPKPVAVLLNNNSNTSCGSPTTWRILITRRGLTVALEAARSSVSHPACVCVRFGSAGRALAGTCHLEHLAFQTPPPCLCCGPTTRQRGGSSMTCQSSESTEAIQNDRRTDNDSRVVESDECRIALAMKDLKNTGWYWGSLTANEAKEILHDASEGTFLVRDSSQRDYLFTISAMTSAGPTNLRIEYMDGKFKLDSVVLVKPKLKQFDSVVHLVEHYVQLSRSLGRGPMTDSVSQPSTAPNGTVQLLLTKPVYTTTPSLQHLCRITINKTTRQVRDLPLPNRLKDYLTDYAYNV